MLYQQGDVLIKEIKKLPKNSKKTEKDSRGIVLAEGESTGHYHAFTKDVDKVLQFTDGTKMYIQVEKPAEIIHQEHNTIVVNPGIYEIGIVQEYDYDEMQARQVRD